MDENKKLRELLWLHHGCPTAILYGDDGKMQCPKHMIDFATDSIDKIERHLSDQSNERVKEAPCTCHNNLLGKYMAFCPKHSPRH